MALYRLDMPVFRSDGFCVACKLPSDHLGNHAISCGSHGERIAFNNHLRDTLFATVASAHLAPTNEDMALLPGDTGRPADIMIKNFCGGSHAAMDVLVINQM